MEPFLPWQMSMFFPASPIFFASFRLDENSFSPGGTNWSSLSDTKFIRGDIIEYSFSPITRKEVGYDQFLNRNLNPI